MQTRYHINIVKTSVTTIQPLYSGGFFFAMWTHLLSLEKKIFPSSFKEEVTVLCVCLSQGYGNTFHKAAGACILCSQACFSVIVHHCCLCARASNNGLSWSCSTCFAEAFKSFHYRNCFIVFLWLIYNSQNCNGLHRLRCGGWKNFLNKWLLIDIWSYEINAEFLP